MWCCHTASFETDSMIESCILINIPHSNDNVKKRQEGYEIRLGKRISVKGKSQKRFIRLDSLPTKYQEDSIRKLFGDDAQVIINPFEKKKPLGFIIDIQEEVLRKGPAYVRWASRFNRNQIGSAISYASTHDIASVDEYRTHVDMLAGQKTDLLTQ